MDGLTSRRSFVTRAGAAVGAVAAAFGLPSAALGAGHGHRKRKRVYKLVPSGPKYDCSASQERNHNCVACNACQSHAKNKLFANKKAAEKERHRAHPHCRCGVKRGRKLSRGTWRDLFRPESGKRFAVVDKRDPRVRRILDAS
jgi:hypothetical protein